MLSFRFGLELWAGRVVWMGGLSACVSRSVGGLHYWILAWGSKSIWWFLDVGNLLVGCVKLHNETSDFVGECEVI